MSLSTINFKRFSIYFFITCILFLMTFIGASEIFLRKKVLPADNFIKYTEILFNRTHGEFAIGDSHMAYGFTHATMTNLSYPSDTIPVMQAKYRGLIRRHIPKRILLESDPHLFSEYRIVPEENYKYIFFQSHSAHFGRLFSLNDFFKRDLFYLWRSYFKAGEFKNQFPIQTNGAQLSNTSLNDYTSEELKANTYLRAQRGTPTIEKRQRPIRMAFENIIQDATSKGIDICLVSFPVSQLYIDDYGDAANPLLDYFATTARNFGVKYVNLRTSLADRSDLFKDGDHLNRIGAELFSNTAYTKCFESKIQNGN